MCERAAQRTIESRFSSFGDTNLLPDSCTMASDIIDQGTAFEHQRANSSRCSEILAPTASRAIAPRHCCAAQMSLAARQRAAAAKPRDEQRIVQRVVAHQMRLDPGDGDKRFHLAPKPRAEGRFAHENERPVRRSQRHRAAALEPVAYEAPIAKRPLPEAPRAHSLALAVLAVEVCGE